MYPVYPTLTIDKRIACMSSHCGRYNDRMIIWLIRLHWIVDSSVNRQALNNRQALTGKQSSSVTRRDMSQALSGNNADNAQKNALPA